MDVLRYLDIQTQPIAFPLRFPMPFLAKTLPPSYVACSLDGVRKKDRLTASFWIETIQRLNHPIVLLGGKYSEELADEVEVSLLFYLYITCSPNKSGRTGGVMQYGNRDRLRCARFTWRRIYVARQ